MRSAYLLVCCLFCCVLPLALSGAPLGAADLGSRQAAPGDGAPSAREVAEFCEAQHQICRRVCYLNSRFEDRFDGCPHSCDSRAVRCTRTGCYRWTEPDYLIARRFGAYRCAE